MTRLMEVGSARSADGLITAPAEDPAAPAAPAPAAPTQVSNQATAAGRMILLALKALSQRALIAATNLVTLIGLGTAFWLWLAVMERTDGPTTSQLIGLGLYGLLLVGLRWVWRLA